ncbi:hypothetical protein D0Z08_19720 [Nocardioides immobilis]|uniref:Uncharacterized protein n=1 Tax=Nocardioides immobilis TaxID=2049295 RepID=A0A417XYL8_9ACTN|nr:hypothetical protein [Nocardioides immobilis]RHW25457.1 hypothetical protein D0Z08_19720 [Nocardioides immobilis]
MTQIRADLNNATPDGRIRVNLARADGSVHLFDQVTLVDSSDPDCSYESIAIEIDEAGRAELQILQTANGLTLTRLWGHPQFESNSPVPAKWGFAAVG